MSRVNEILSRETPRSSVVFAVVEGGNVSTSVFRLSTILLNTTDKFEPIVVQTPTQRIVVNSIKLLKLMIEEYNTFVLDRNTQGETDMFPVDRIILMRGNIERITDSEDLSTQSILEASDKEKSMLTNNLNKYLRRIEVLKEKIRNVSNFYADSIEILAPEVQREITDLIMQAQEFLRQYDQGREISINLGDIDEVLRNLDRMSVIQQRRTVDDMKRVAQEVRTDDAIARIERLSVAPPAPYPRPPEKRIPIIPFQRLTSRRDDYRDESPELEQPSDADVVGTRRRVMHSSDEEDGERGTLHERDYHPAQGRRVLRDREEIDSISDSLRGIRLKQQGIHKRDFNSYNELRRLQHSLSLISERIQDLPRSYRKEILIRSFESLSRIIENKLS